MDQTSGPPASKGYLQPAFFGGLFMGVLSALPLVSAGNVCCCLWVVAGGLLSTYLLQQNRADAITAADGAIVGLLAGVIGTVIQFLIAVPVSWMVGPLEQQVLERLREMAGPNTPMPRPSPIGTVGVALFRLMAFVITLVIGSIVSTLAGVVGAAIFAKRPAAGAPLPAVPGSFGPDEQPPAGL
jgi:hypothetical protein